MDLHGQQIAVLGAGRSGRAAAVLAKRLGGEVTLYDSRGEDAFADIPEGISCHPGATLDTGRGVQADLVVVSPGIETGGEFVQSFAQGAGELIGETELASRVYEGKIIGITGTNGKTTTTELVERILRAGDMTCAAAGNYGTPLAEVVCLPEVPETVALELSSFQLETIRTFRPGVAIWLNFSPDHMDRYRTVAEYREAKLRIFENQTAEDTAIVRAGEDVGELKATRISFSATDADADYTLEGMTVHHAGAPVLNLEDTRMRGLHNAENIMAALAAGAALGVSPQQAADALRDYAPPVHRCELVGILDGVEYINDSKATNLHALESALRSQTRPTVLIAGGKDKGLDYSPLVPLLAGKVSDVILIGEIRQSLGKLLESVVATAMCDSLDEAVRVAAGKARHGATVLFSPGTSSFDMFSGYEARGEAFRAAVQKLK